MADGATLDPDSAGLVAELQRQVADAGSWINTWQYSARVYVVAPNAPTVAVHIDTPNSMYAGRLAPASLQADFSAVPIPPDARPSAGTDHHLVIWQPSSDTLWEMFLVRNVPQDPDLWRTGIEGWHAAWGAKVENVSQDDGIDPSPYGATASGLPLVGGLIAPEELASGQIDHALALAIPQPARRFVWPATRTDGRDPDPNAVPEGQRFRLDPSVDVNSLGLPPAGVAIARAAQRYGIVVRDTSGAVTFYAEDPMNLGSNPYPSLFRGQWPSTVLERFPWDRLQALDPSVP